MPTLNRHTNAIHLDVQSSGCDTQTHATLAISGLRRPSHRDDETNTFIVPPPHFTGVSIRVLYL